MIKKYNKIKSIILPNKKINILKSLGFRHLFKKFSIKKEIREIDRIL